MITQYDLVCTHVQKDFLQAVNAKLKQGWEPHGVLIMHNGYYVQALIKKE